jgi:phosphoribosylformylglycinamidine synthase subunit PurS
MKFVAEIDIMPHRELLDPQGKTVLNNLKHIDLSGFADVRMGKHVQMTLEANDETSARAAVDTACKKLLANLIMESYTFELKKV